MRPTWKESKEDSLSELRQARSPGQIFHWEGIEVGHKNMEAVATLAGAIAHQFNNALVGITGSIELLKMDLPDDESLGRYLEPMEASVRRMAELTDQLLAYAQGGKYQPRTLSLRDLIEESLPLIRHPRDSAISVETDLPADIYPVKADPTQVQMVVRAVVANAAEAIEGQGRISISMRNKEVNKAPAKHNSGIKPGSYVCVIVEDDGKGMDESTKKRIFQPFFTTKFQGRGLSMAAVYGIVKNHGGSISVDSELAKGTVIKIYLPAVEVQMDVEEGEALEVMQH